MRRTQGSRKRKTEAVKRSRNKVVRKERRGGTVALVGAIYKAHVEPDRAVVEAEDRDAVEPAIGIRTVFVTGALDVQVLPLNEPLGMRQDHASHDERSDAEFVGVADDLAHSPDGPTTMG